MFVVVVRRLFVVVGRLLFFVVFLLVGRLFRRFVVLVVRVFGFVLCILGVLRGFLFWSGLVLLFWCRSCS